MPTPLQECLLNEKLLNFRYDSTFRQALFISESDKIEISRYSDFWKILLLFVIKVKIMNIRKAACYQQYKLFQLCRESGNGASYR